MPLDGGSRPSALEIEPFGNLTITVTPGGEVSIRLPSPLEHFANARRRRYFLPATFRFSYRQY